MRDYYTDGWRVRVRLTIDDLSDRIIADDARPQYPDSTRDDHQITKLTLSHRQPNS